MSEIAELRALMREMQGRLSVRLRAPVIWTSPLGDGTPHFEATPEGLDYVVVDRGRERRRERGLTPREAVYLLMHGATLQAALASEDQIKTRPVCRWNWMARHIQMMGEMDESWGAGLAADYADVLKRFPLTAQERAAIDPKLPRPPRS